MVEDITQKKGVVKTEFRPVGRPTDYPGDAPMQKMIDMYLRECREKSNLPTRCGVAVYFGVCKATIDNWEKDHAEFLGALGRLKMMQEEALINKGLTNEYNSTITKLMLSSNHGYKERSDTTSDGKPIQPAIVNFADVAPKENKKEDDSNDTKPSSD